jgi:ADP-heptose:LPS heptosyltransferase
VTSEPPLELRLTPAERQAGEQRLSQALAQSMAESPSAGAPRVGLFANASGNKGYPQAWWRELIPLLRRDLPGIQLLEFIPDDGRARLAEDLPGLFTPELRLLAATLAATSLLVIADGGVMHLAEAAGARVLALFRDTAPARYGPYRPRSAAIWAPQITPAEAAEQIRAMLAQR